RRATGFIAPAWLYSDDARAALGDAGFGLAEDHFRVWTPADGKVIARGPVITWASRSRGRQLSSLAAAAVLRHGLRPTPVARVAQDARFSITQPINRLSTGCTAARADGLGE